MTPDGPRYARTEGFCYPYCPRQWPQTHYQWILQYAYEPERSPLVQEALAAGKCVIGTREDEAGVPSVLTLAEPLDARAAAKRLNVTERTFRGYVTSGHVRRPELTILGEEVWDPEVLAFATGPAASCWIYLIASRQHVKVGYAANVETRLSTLQTSHPEKLRLLGKMRAPKEIEGRIHSALRAYRATGEWFRKGPWVVAMLTCIEDGVKPDEIVERLEALGK